MELELKEKTEQENKLQAKTVKSEKELKAEIQSREANIQDKIAQIESGVFIHYSVIIGFLLALIPNFVVMKCFCPGKKKVDWKAATEELKKEVAKEEARLDIELKKVMEERKSLESKIAGTPGCEKIKVSEILSLKID